MRRCSASLANCEVMRTCTKCKQVFGNTGQRIVHENSCTEPMDVEFATLQHDHRITAHRGRRRS